MKILTVVRQVPDAEETVRVTNNAVDFPTDKLVLDGMDEYGVEEALRLLDNKLATEVIALAVGPARTEDALRAALAMGAHRAILVETETELDPISLSKVVAEVAQKEGVELIFTGGQQADWDSQALGAATAERLGWPQVTWTNALSLNGGSLETKHVVDDGTESCTVPLPAVITTQQGLNEPRYVTLPNIVKARKKELRKDKLEQYGTAPKVRFLGAEIQVSKRMNKVLDGKDPQAAVSQLLDLLRNEAKVIA